MTQCVVDWVFRQTSIGRSGEDDKQMFRIRAALIVAIALVVVAVASAFGPTDPWPPPTKTAQPVVTTTP